MRLSDQISASSVERFVSLFLPGMANELLERIHRFRRLGYSYGRAVRSSGSSADAEALRFTRLDLLPPGEAVNLNTVVDVGANEGHWTNSLLRLVSPQKIIMAEPDPRLFDQLKQIASGNQAIEFHPVALGASAGRRVFNFTQHSHNNSFFLPKQGEFSDSGLEVIDSSEVEVKTLDELTAGLDEMSLLKIDVQGAESEVLQGAEQTLKKTKYILMETNFVPYYEQDSSVFASHELLLKSGFALSQLSEPYRVNGVATWADGLYVKASLS